MATQSTKAHPGAKGFHPEQVESELTNLIYHVKENPMLYAAGVLFVIVCLLASVMYRAGVSRSRIEAATTYAKAMDNPDPVLRAGALKGVVEGGGLMAAQAAYMMGEAYYESGNADEAGKAWEQIRANYADSQYVPDAIEGLGNIAENKGDFNGALALYKEIREKHPESFTAVRQLYNIGRCQEALGQVKEAVASYQEQVTLLADSGVSAQAQAALDRLQKSNPDLFPAQNIAATPAPDAAVTPTTDAAPAVEVAPVPAPEASAAPAPEAAPAETAPVATPAPEEAATAPAQQ